MVEEMKYHPHGSVLLHHAGDGGSGICAPDGGALRSFGRIVRLVPLWYGPNYVRGDVGQGACPGSRPAQWILGGAAQE
jgi:hypothetical protein